MKFIAILITSCFLFNIQLLAQEKQTRNVGSFSGIALSSGGTVYLTQGDEEKVEVQASSDIIDEIITEVRGGTLVIKRRDSDSWFSWGSSSGSFDVYVTARRIEEVDVSGSGRIYGQNKITSDRLELDVSGSGRMELKVYTKMIEADISGSGRIQLEGNGTDLEVSISGSGSVDAIDFAVENCEARISGSGRCEVNVSKSIDARISGSGSVYYKGEPDKINSSTSGSGRVKKIS